MERWAVLWPRVEAMERGSMDSEAMLRKPEL